MTTTTLRQLAQDIEGFLAFKHALGYRYERNEYMLRNFLEFARQHNEKKRDTKRSKIDIQSTLQTWLSRSKDRKPNTVFVEFSTIRQLCLFTRRRCPNAFVPDRTMAPYVVSNFRPYIFSPAEITRILQAAQLDSGTSVWPGMLYTLLLILYCTGLRLGEAVRLRLSDVDLQQKTFLIRKSKGRTRFVPFGQDLAVKISLYLDERERLLNGVGKANENALFVRKTGKPLTEQFASLTVRKLFIKLGLKPAKGRTGPRPYDFRHTYAVYRLSEWYQQGVDIHARLPWLSAYMGHVNLVGTETYLHATTELLQLASDRFEKHFNMRRRK